MNENTTMDALIAQIQHLLEQGDDEEAAQMLRDLHPADSAELLYELEPDHRARMLQLLEWETVADVLEELDQEDMVEIVRDLSVAELADVLDEMEPDMAADLLGELSDDEAAVLIDEMEESDEVVSLLAYPEDTAGGIMTSARHMLRRFMTVQQAMDFLREYYADEHDLYYLYVLDRFQKLVGVVSLRALVLAEPQQTLGEIMHEEVTSVAPETDQEEVARLLARYNLLALPVVDENQRMLGMVTVDDVVDVIEEEATEDIYRLAQLGEDSEVFSPIAQAIRHRLPWLSINMVTAFVSSTVVALFAGTIGQVAILAALMPIVAAQGGNAGNQSMTIVVRSLGLGEISVRDAWRVLRHEINVGVLHGLLLGMMVATISLIWLGNPYLSMIIGLAMLGNLFVAALVGVLVPMTLSRFGLDPALGSSMFVTATTDILGFTLFLG
ncbi:MAG: magnesium transporter, partial [Caldilineaceae bacterium]|nr:magnesium transporter [Caldilineaceae bacterium]